MTRNWKVVTLLCACAALTTWSWTPPNDWPRVPLNCRAQTKLVFESREDSPVFRGTIALQFGKDGTGIIGLTGMLSIGKQHYRVLRTATLRSKVIDADHGWFDIRRTSDAIQEHDNAPTEVVNTYLLGLINQPTPRVFRVTRLNDKAFIVGNIHSPFMVCSQVNV